MAADPGKRYVSSSGAEVIVTRGGPGVLSDAETPLLLKEQAGEPTNTTSRSEPVVVLGKRYRSADGEVELLVIRAGVCDLRYDGAPMEALQPKILPSAD
jgi:hypothetical protein